MEAIAVIVLAAGRGKRTGQDDPKVLLRTSEDSLIGHVLRSTVALAPALLSVVVGYKRERVEEELSAAQRNGAYGSTPISFAVQPEQLGTGDAVRAALPFLKEHVGAVLILCGDVPLVSTTTLRALIDTHQHSKATVTMLSASLEDPASYGRVLRGADGRVTGVREAKDCAPRELLINEVAAGIYVVDSAFLHPAIEALENKNAQSEFYLTDIVARAATEGQRVESVTLTKNDEFLGVNDLADLARVNEVLSRRRIERFSRAGVIFEHPTSCIVDATVSIAAGVRIGPNVQLRGATSLAAGVMLEGDALLIDAIVGERTLIRLGVRAQEVTIAENAAVGPFAHLRPGTKLGSGVHIGNFVETKNAYMHQQSKANHLTYLGDCEIGPRSNIGAGTITCNYDGYKKYQTTIGADVFVGSNTSLVAPVTVNAGATVGAGSVITQDVESDALGIARAPQVIKSGWSKRRREIMAKKEGK